MANRAVDMKSTKSQAGAPKKAGKRRKKRTTEEIIELLIDAASEEFERNGYSNTRTAAIANRAGVAEFLIFNHFGSKAKLFQDAIFLPLERHFDEFQATHPIPADDLEGRRAGSEQFINEMQAFMAQHSRMFLSLAMAQSYQCDGIEGLADVEALQNYFENAAAAADRRMSVPKIDPRLMARISFASILACIIFKDWLFPSDLCDDEILTKAVTDYVLEGLSANQGGALRRT